MSALGPKGDIAAAFGNVRSAPPNRPSRISAEMVAAFLGARKNRLDLSVDIALGSAAQIALFVAPVQVLPSYVIGPSPMDLQFLPGAVVMVLVATLTAAFITNGGRSAWFVGILAAMVYLIFAMTLYILPPGGQ